LNDVECPASKDDPLRAAVRNGCDDDTARPLRAIPPETSANLAEMLASVTAGDDGISDADKAAARRSHTKLGRAQSAKDITSSSPIVDELGENLGS
jgi:hypothetical protein